MRSPSPVPVAWPAKRGPKGPSRLSDAVVADIRARRRAGRPSRGSRTRSGCRPPACGAPWPTRPRPPAPRTTPTRTRIVTVRAARPASRFPTRRRTQMTSGHGCGCAGAPAAGAAGPGRPVGGAGRGPVGPARPCVPGVRCRRPGAVGGVVHDGPRPGGHRAAGLRRTVFGGLPAGFYGLDTMLIEAVARALLGESRAEGATRVDPVALGRVLGLDRSPEVTTIRRKIHLLAQGKAETCWRRWPPTTSRAPRRRGGAAGGRACARLPGTKIAKTHVTRLRFPAPATVETWVCDAAGDPVLVVMANPARPWPWNCAACSRSCGRGRGRPAGAGRVRPRRLVPGPVRRPARRRVRHPDLAQGRRPTTCPRTCSPP